MVRPKKERKEGDVQFITTDLRVTDKLRVEHGILPIEAIGTGPLQPKKYVFAESEEEINALLASKPEEKTE